MNSRVQSYGILLLTLLIGVLLGFLINGQIVRNRMDKARASFQKKEGRLEELLNKVALSDSQKQVVKPIFEAHFRRMREIHGELRQELRSEMREFRESLSEYLDEEQLRTLEAELRMGRRKNGRHRGPGPGNRPPHEPPPRH